MVDSYTLENVVIDNYIFGVASVSEDGYESPVVFPGPTGSFGQQPAFDSPAKLLLFLCNRNEGVRHLQQRSSLYKNVPVFIDNESYKVSTT